MRKKSMRFISAALAACMMASTLPVNALALEDLPGGSYSENGVTAQENEEAEPTPTELIPTKSITITEGGNYVIPEGTYAGNITIKLTDTTETVNITIKGDVTPTYADPFINVVNAGVVNVDLDGHVFDGATYKRHFMYLYNSTADVTVSNGRFKASSFHPFMTGAGKLTVNDVEMETGTYCIVATGSSNVTVNSGRYTFSNSTGYPAVFVCNGGSMTLNDVTVTSTEAVLSASNSTVVVNGGDFQTTGTKSCFVNSSANLTINKGITTEGTFASEGASCINNSWGQVRINGGSFTTDAGIAVKNRGGLRLNGGTVEAPNGTAIDISGESGDVQLNGGTIRNSVTGVRVADAGDSEIALKAVTFENNTDDISLGEDQQINIKKTFTGKAKILVDDAKAGRRITQENDDARYQKDLNLVSNNEGYIVGYKREDGVEYRYLADANGNAVSTQDAKATANLGAGAQQLDTTDVVPEGKDVTVTADIPAGAEFLEWSVVRADGEALDWTLAEDDPQTITFKMPGCNVTVAALYQNNTPDPVNPGGGDDPVTEFFEAAAVTGVAAAGPLRDRHRHLPRAEHAGHPHAFQPRRSGHPHLGKGRSARTPDPEDLQRRGRKRHLPAQGRQLDGRTGPDGSTGRRQLQTLWLCDQAAHLLCVGHGAGPRPCGLTAQHSASSHGPLGEMDQR